MPVDRASFYVKCRSNFNRDFTDAQKKGYEAIFNYWDPSPLNDFRWLAYALATAHHETGGRIEPVREGFADTDEGSIRAVTSLFNKRRIKRNYAVPHPNGNSYFGRGLVQLTHGYNYDTFGKLLGIDLYNNPSLALDLNTSVVILFEGMVRGLYRPPHRLSTYFNDTKTEWINARNIINGGLDRAADIKKIALKYYDAIDCI